MSPVFGFSYGDEPQGSLLLLTVSTFPPLSQQRQGAVAFRKGHMHSHRLLRDLGSGSCPARLGPGARRDAPTLRRAARTAGTGAPRPSAPSAGAGRRTAGAAGVAGARRSTRDRTPLPSTWVRTAP